MFHVISCNIWRKCHRQNWIYVKYCQQHFQTLGEELGFVVTGEFLRMMGEKSWQISYCYPSNQQILLSHVQAYAFPDIKSKILWNPQVEIAMSVYFVIMHAPAKKRLCIWSGWLLHAWSLFIGGFAHCTGIGQRMWLDRLYGWSSSLMLSFCSAYMGGIPHLIPKDRSITGSA